MKIDREHLIGVFAELGRRLDGFGSDARSAATMAAAIERNGWFTPAEIIAAVESIRAKMLDESTLREWLTNYPVAREQRTVGLIMAGNIPLVGFFDILCILVSGHRLAGKASSKDEILSSYILSQLTDIDPALPVSPLERCTPNAIIATGSDNTNRYFRSRYGSIPAIFRGNRSSVAVLSGDETEKELGFLATDIFTYSGLGCRNVSHLIVPTGYDIHSIMFSLSRYTDVNPKYVNNFRQRSAMLTTAKEPFMRGPFFVLRHTVEFPSYISEITWHESADSEETSRWLARHDSEIQCVVGRATKHPREVGFGQSQSPGLADYPDAIDTMTFLATL